MHWYDIGHIDFCYPYIITILTNKNQIIIYLPPTIYNISYMYKWTTALQWRVAALKAVFFFYFDFYAFILYAAVVKIFFWEILISSFFSNLLFNPNKFSQLPLLLCAFSSIAGGITCVAYTVQKLRSSILQQIAKGAQTNFAYIRLFPLYS